MDKYVFISHLGKGNFGAVSKIKRKHDNKVLIWKELSYAHLSQKEKQQIVTEVNVLRELNHPNIVSYVDRIIDKKNLKLYIVMEYCEKGDLGQLIKRLRKNKTRLPETQIWAILTQLGLALKHCHHKRVLHRDIKASNVFQDKYNVIKLGDFGLSKVLDEESVFAYSKVGTPYYMSPEQIDERKYNEKSDVWSLGCLLYELCELHPPFEAKTHVQLAMKIKNGKVERIHEMYSDELWRCIKRMLKVDVEKRADVDEVMNMPMVYLRVKEKEFTDWERRLNEKEEMLREKEVMLMQQQKQLQMQVQMYNGSQISNYTSYKSTNANTAEGSESKEKHSDNSSHNNSNSNSNSNHNNHLYMKNSNSMEYLVTTQQNQMNNMVDNNNIPHTTRLLNYKLKEKMATFMSNSNIRKPCEPIIDTCYYKMGCNSNYNNALEVYGSAEILKRNMNENNKHKKTNSNCKRASTPNLMMTNMNMNNNGQHVVCGNYTTSNLHRNTISHNYHQGHSNVISMIRNNSSNQLHVLRNAYTSDIVNVNNNISTPTTTRMFKRKKVNN